MKKRYVGSPATNASAPHVVSVYEEYEDSTFFGVLAHVVKHSPSGFSWGYRGSGPAELARCLLIDALGVDGRCPTCGGSGKVCWLIEVGPNGEQYRPTFATASGDDVTTCPECGGSTYGPNVESVYQRFKEAYVARWGQDEGFEITQDEILAFVKSAEATT